MIDVLILGAGPAGLSAAFLPFALQLRGWTKQLTVFTRGLVTATEDTLEQLKAANIVLETQPWRNLSGPDTLLQGVELSDGRQVACQQLFVHPPQHQVPVVKQLVEQQNLVLDEAGYVQVDPMTKQSSVPGIYAAGDLTTRMQGAVFAAAAGVQAAAMMNYELTVDLVKQGNI